MSSTNPLSLVSGTQNEPTPQVDLSIRPRPTISDLPLEVLAIIQIYIEPRDIISLRKTCKHVAASTRDRTVWIKTLNRICSMHGILTQTFPIKLMTQKAIEFASLTPYRFTTLLTKERPEAAYLKPFATRILRSRGHLINGPNGAWRVVEGKFTNIWLVPGGRFLLTKSANHLILLWDLGYSAETMIKPQPIASYTRTPLLNATGPCEVVLKGIQRSVYGEGICLFLEEVLLSGRELTVCEVYPLDSNPQISCIRSLKMPDETPVDWVTTQGMVAFHYGRLVTVWNFIEDSVVTWDVQEEYTHLLVYPEVVLLFDQNRFTTWKTPPFEERDDSSLPLEPIQSEERPIFSFTHSRHPEECEDLSVSSVTWQPHSPRPISFSLQCFVDGVGILDHYLMKPLGNNDDLLPSFMPVLISSSNLNGNDYPFSESVKVVDPCLHFCDRWLVKAWSMEGGWCMVNITEVAEARITVASHTRTICPAPTTEAFKMEQFSLCPVSGRLCGLVDGQEIRVMDFVVPN